MMSGILYMLILTAVQRPGTSGVETSTSLPVLPVEGAEGNHDPTGSALSPCVSS